MLTAALIGTIVVMALAPFIMRLFTRRNDQPIWGCCCPGGVMGAVLIVLILIYVYGRYND